MMLLIIIVEFIWIVFVTKKAFMFYKKAYKSEASSIQRFELIQFFKTVVEKKGCGFEEFFKHHNIKKIAVYGIGMVYKAVEEELLDAVEVKYYIDKYSTLSELNGVQVIHNILDVLKMEAVDAVVITAVGYYQEIEKELRECNLKTRLIDIEKIVYYDKNKKLC